MMFAHAILALFAPALARGAAFPWTLPEPTLVAPAADNWSPAPTAPARLPGFELFKRQSRQGEYTCGFVSGLSESSITCFNTNYICATNTVFGVHGCCDPGALNACTIPTTCIGSAAMATACTDAACSSNGQIAKCTDSVRPECYRWLFQYDKTIMTQHGCAEKGFTSTALRSFGQLVSTIPPELYRTVTTTVIPSTTLTHVPTPSPSKPNIRVIVGSTVGGCVFISLLAILVFLIYRRRRNDRNSLTQAPLTRFHDPVHGVTEYNPHGFMSPVHDFTDKKAWQDQPPGPVHRMSDAMPQYPHMGAGQYGIVEVDGIQRPVEAEAETVYYAQEYRRS